MNAKTDPLEPEWIDWLQHNIQIVNDAGFLVMPLRGLVYQVNKSARIATLVAVYKPALNDSVQVMTDRLFNHLGWKVVVAEGAVKNTAQEFITFIKTTHTGEFLVSVDLLEQLEKQFRK